MLATLGLKHWVILSGLFALGFFSPMFWLRPLTAVLLGDPKGPNEQIKSRQGRILNGCWSPVRFRGVPCFAHCESDTSFRL
jgi:hypothetical protein